MKWETSLFQRIKRFLRDKSFPTFIYIHSPFLPFLSFFSPFSLWTNFIEIISEARGGAWSIKPWRCLTDLCYSTNLCFFAIRVTLFLLAERETSSSWLIDQRQVSNAFEQPIEANSCIECIGYCDYVLRDVLRESRCREAKRNVATNCRSIRTKDWKGVWKKKIITSNALGYGTLAASVAINECIIHL